MWRWSYGRYANEQTDLQKIKLKLYLGLWQPLLSIIGDDFSRFSFIQVSYIRYRN